MRWPKWNQLNRHKKRNFILKCIKKLDVALDPIAEALYMEFCDVCEKSYQGGCKCVDPR